MLPWENIDTVMLDMDGTLLDLHFDTFFWLEYLPQRYADIHGLAAEKARESLHHQIRKTQGKLNWYCTDYWARQLEVDIMAFKEEIAHKVALRPAVEPFLAAARQSGRRVVIVTNCHPDPLALKMRQVDLRPWVDDIIVSHDFGMPKEDSAFWEQLQKVEPYTPARTLFVDDSTSVLASAQNAGIGYVLQIAKPDSQKPPVNTAAFPLLESFADILPPVL
ncbi:GMP/IMP nucleotidase [Pokkaliibacter sp. CJK22405]|uniref:GMP/IMP nucleotidase n=1 Tax=Pokkaliibacter sp. CJK22405 TaxID=3384615 RepID=UPI0039849F1E